MTLLGLKDNLEEENFPKGQRPPKPNIVKTRKDILNACGVGISEIHESKSMFFVLTCLFH